MGSNISQDAYGLLEDDQDHSPKSQLKTMPREFDPRSPSYGIFRTPIQITVTPVRMVDMHAPCTGIEQTPVSPFKMDSEDEVCGKNLENFDAAVGKTENQNDVPNVPILDLSITESLPEEMNPFVSVAAFSQQVRTEPVVYSDCGEFQSAKIRGESLKFKPSLQSNVPRSPLVARNVDAGSLRSAVQLKEAKKAEIFRHLQSSGDPRNRKLSAFDKENV